MLNQAFVVVAIAGALAVDFFLELVVVVVSRVAPCVVVLELGRFLRRSALHRGLTLLVDRSSALGTRHARRLTLSGSATLLSSSTSTTTFLTSGSTRFSAVLALRVITFFRFLFALVTTGTATLLYLLFATTLFTNCRVEVVIRRAGAVAGIFAVVVVHVLRVRLVFI